MFVECIQCVKARLRTKGGKWHAHAPGCDLAHEEGLTVSQRGCAKAVERLLRAKLGAYSAPKVLMVLILRVWVARRAIAQGVGI